MNGPVARVWKMELSRDSKESAPAQVAMALVHAPGSHPIWPWKLISIVTLAELEGVPPPWRSFEGAEYELQVVSLDPGEPLGNLDGSGAWRPLQPVDVIHQVGGIGASAQYFFDEVLARVADGRLVPDSDYRRYWAQSLDQIAKGVGASTPN